MWSLSRTLLATVTLLLVACASTGPQRTDDGLERVPSRVVDAVYVRPAADLPRYDRLLLEPVVVQFDRHWDPRDFGLWGLQADEVATEEQVQNLTTAYNVARSNLDAVRFNARFARIEAPVEGLVLQRLSEENELVQGGQPVLVLWRDRRRLGDPGGTGRSGCGPRRSG